MSELHCVQRLSVDDTSSSCITCTVKVWVALVRRFKISAAYRVRTLRVCGLDCCIVSRAMSGSHRAKCFKCSAVYSVKTADDDARRLRRDISALRWCSKGIPQPIGGLAVRELEALVNGGTTESTLLFVEV